MPKYSINLSRYIMFISLACLKKKKRNNSEEELYNLLINFKDNDESKYELDKLVNKFIGLTSDNLVAQPERNIVLFLQNDVSKVMLNEEGKTYKTILNSIKKKNPDIIHWEIYDHCSKNIENKNVKKNKNKYMKFKVSDLWSSSKIAHSYKNEMYCGYCKMELIQVSSGKKIGYYELDHVYAKSKHPGLMYYAPNLIPSCKTCNSKKSSTNYLEVDDTYHNLVKLNKNRNRLRDINDYLEIKFKEPILVTQGTRTLQDFALTPEVKLLGNDNLTKIINLKNRTTHMTNYFQSEAEKFTKLINSDYDLLSCDTFQELTKKVEFQAVFGRDFDSENIGEYEPFVVYRYKLFEEIYKMKKEIIGG